MNKTNKKYSTGTVIVFHHDLVNIVHASKHINIKLKHWKLLVKLETWNLPLNSSEIKDNTIYFVLLQHVIQLLPKWLIWHWFLLGVGSLLSEGAGVVSLHFCPEITACKIVTFKCSNQVFSHNIDSCGRLAWLVVLFALTLNQAVFGWSLIFLYPCPS